MFSQTIHETKLNPIYSTHTIYTSRPTQSLPEHLEQYNTTLPEHLEQYNTTLPEHLEQYNTTSKKKCNCRGKDFCPLNGKYLTKSIVYRAKIKSDQDTVGF